MGVLIVSAVFPPEPVVSGRLSMDLYRCLKERGFDARVLHPYPTRPYGFKPDKRSIGTLGEDEIITDYLKLSGRRELYLFCRIASGG